MQTKSSKKNTIFQLILPGLQLVATSKYMVLLLFSGTNHRGVLQDFPHPFLLPVFLEESHKGGLEGHSERSQTSESR